MPDVEAAGGGSRTGRRWAGPAVAFFGALAVAALALVTNRASNAIPVSWAWASDGRILWPAAGILAMLTAVLAWRAARVSEEAVPSTGPLISAGAGSVVAGAGSAVETLTVGDTSGGVTIIAPGGTVTIPVPEPAPAAKPGQLVLGELPGPPPSFQDRPQLADLVRVFDSGGGVAVVCALTGARGVGKTQLAAAYARQQVGAGCPLVAWVSAESSDDLMAGLAEVAREVGVADPEGDSTKSALRLRDHLRTRQDPALLVIDNAVDADQVRRVLPVTGPTQVIVTSIDHALGQLGTEVDVSVFDRPQSLTYLRARTGLDDDEGADRVAEQLGDLPLALAQAASVIVMKENLDYADYLTRLDRVPVGEVLTRHSGDPYPRGTAEAILLSIHDAEDTDETGLIQRLLAVMAVLAPTGVHRTLLREVLNVGGGDITRSADVARVDEMLARLVALSLLTWGEAGASVILHRLVARVIRDRLHAAGHLAATIVDTVEVLSALRIPENQAWARREQGAELVGHALAVWDIVINQTGDDRLTSGQIARCAQMVSWAVRHLNVTADLSRSIRIGERTLAEFQWLLGEDHPDTLGLRNNLAGAYGSAGRLSEAIHLHETNLAEYERVLGQDHPDTLTSRNNLAYAYESAGRLSEAIYLHETNLAEYERVLGQDHPATLTSRNNLASSYESAGRLAKAIQLYEINLAERKRVLGEDHPHTLTSRNNLAHAYESVGRLSEAIQLHETTLVECERALGKDHPHTLGSRNNLAHAYRSAGRLSEAVQLYETNLAEYERVLGQDHPDTLTSRNNLASSYELAGRLAKAIQLHETTLAKYEQALGEDHPHTLTSRNNLAHAYRTAGRLAKAIQLYETNLAEYERVLGEDHPDPLTSRNNLAYAYELAGRLAKAIQLYETNLAERKRVLGEDHRDTLTSRNNLAHAYESAGRLAKAIQLYETNLAKCERVLGEDHPVTRTARENLGWARRR